MEERTTTPVPPQRPEPDPARRPEHQPVKGLQRGQGSAIAGLFFAAWAVWVLPYFFGPLGMLMGAVAYARGERRGRWVILIAAAAMTIGLLFGLLPDKFAEN